MILEEQKSVFKILKQYLDGQINQQTLSSHLVNLVEEKKGKNKRPISPNVPRRDALVIMVNTLVKSSPLLNEHELEILNKLIFEGNELVYSSYEVFESDQDEEDFLDSLKRIVISYNTKVRIFGVAGLIFKEI